MLHYFCTKLSIQKHNEMVEGIKLNKVMLKFGLVITPRKHYSFMDKGLKE